MIDDIEKLSESEFLELDNSSTIYLKYLEYLNYYRQCIKDSEKYRIQEIYLYHDILDQISEHLLNFSDCDTISIINFINSLLVKYNIFGSMVYDDNVYDEDVLGNYGITVTTGKGCCRNYSYFYRDLLLRMGIDAYAIRVRTVDDNKIESDHMCLSFYYNGYTLIYDPLNNNYYNIIGLKAYSLTDYGVIKISPYSYIIENGMSVDDIKNEVLHQGKEMNEKDKNDIILKSNLIKNYINSNSVLDLKYNLSKNVNEIKTLRLSLK